MDASQCTHIAVLTFNLARSPPQLMLKTRHITIALMIMLAVSISAFMAITLGYQQFPIGLRNLFELQTYLPAVEQLQTWFCAAILAFIALLPDIFVKVQCGEKGLGTGNGIIPYAVRGMSYWQLRPTKESCHAFNS